MSRLIAALSGTVLGFAALVTSVLVVQVTISGAEERLTSPEKEVKQLLPTAQHAEASYCTPKFKEVLERVLHSCGLVTSNARRGCKPADVRTFASISDDDFNALFRPLKDRGGVVLFPTGQHELDAESQALVDKLWADRRGARYFLVVGRASTTGTAGKNRALSHRRANSVLFRIKERSQDPEVDKKVGLLWLGSEFAQLNPEEFCAWPRSRKSKACDDKAINQSAFASWVDCRL